MNIFLTHLILSSMFILSSFASEKSLDAEACISKIHHFASQLEPYSINKISILLAEDSIVSQKIFKHIFSSNKYNIELSDNGSIALEKIKHNYYDILVTDVEMPEMNGINLTSSVRDMNIKSKCGNRIPIIVCSTIEDFEEEAIKAGGNAFLKKPFCKNELISLLNSLLLT